MEDIVHSIKNYIKNNWILTRTFIEKQYPINSPILTCSCNVEEITTQYMNQNMNKN